MNGEALATLLLIILIFVIAPLYLIWSSKNGGEKQ